MNGHKRASRFWAFFMAVIMTITMLPSNALVPVFAQEAETPVIAPENVNGDAEINEEIANTAEDNGGNMEVEENAEAVAAPDAIVEDAAGAGQSSSENSVIVFDDRWDISKNATTYKETKDFYGAWYNSSIAAPNVKPADSTVSGNDEDGAVEELFKTYYSNSANAVEPDYKYEWFEVAADGKTETQMKDADGKNIEGQWLSPDILRISNALSQDKTYLCRISLEGITVSDADGKVIEKVSVESADKNVLAKYGNKKTVDYYCTIAKYSGPTKDTIKNYVSISANLKDRTVTATSDETETSVDFFEDDDLNSEITCSRNVADYGYINIENYLSYHSVLKPYFTDGTEGKPIEDEISKDYQYPNGTGSSIREIPACTAVDDSGENVRWVDHYDWSMDVYYGAIQVGTTQKKKVTIQTDPVNFAGIEVDGKEQTLSNNAAVIEGVRKGETKKLTANVDLKAGWSNCGIKYQWQQSTDGNNWSDIAGQTAKDMMVKITDLKIRYRCKINVIDNNKDMYLPYMGYSAEFRFGDSFDSGYAMISKSPLSVMVDYGQEFEFYVEAAVDPGYNLSYQWSKPAVDDDGDWKVDENGEKVWETISGQTGNSYKVKPVKAADFYEVNSSFKVEITLTSTTDSSLKKVVGSEEFRYYASSSVLATEVIPADEENLGIHKVEVANGEPAVMEVKTAGQSDYTIEKTWHKVKDIKEVKWVNNGVWYRQFVDPNFVPPAGEEPLDMSFREDKNDSFLNYKVYLEKDALAATDNGSKLTVSGANVLGDYVCEVKCYPTSDAANKDKKDNKNVITGSYLFRVSQKSDVPFLAYAKNETIRKVVGESATLSVFATNSDPTKYPITYQWEKLNNATKQYEKLNNATASYTISSLTKADFTDYRVTVADGVNKKILKIKLVEKDKNVISYTRPTTLIQKKAGETAELKVNAVLPSGASNVTYTWEQKIDGEDKWRELTGYTTDTYSTVVKEDKEEVYRCKVTYVYKDELVEDYPAGTSEDTYVEEYYNFKVKTPGDTTYEKLSPETQTKGLGEDVTFSLRVITNKEGITNDSISYQWYKFNDDFSLGQVPYLKERYRLCDEKLEGQTSSSMTRTALKLEDYGKYYCAVKVGNEYEAIVFEVQGKCPVKLDLKANKDRIKVSLGQDVTLTPVLNNTEGHTLTYKWFWNGLEIPGATSSSYEIKNIGEGDLAEYTMKISCEEHGLKEKTIYTVTLVEKTTEAPTKIEVEPAKGFEQNIEAVLGKTNVEFKVEAKSSKNLELKYQWSFKKNGSDEDIAIDGAIADTYTLPLVTSDNYGTYTCWVVDTEGNRESCSFNLIPTKDLVLTDEGAEIGYKTKLGGNITLNAKAAIDPTYSVVYQWYKYDDELKKDGKVEPFVKLENETSATLKRTKVTLDDLGRYRCVVRSSNGQEFEEDIYKKQDGDLYITYRVYIPSGLVVEAGPAAPEADSKGVVNMFVTARADSGEKIKYSWYRYVEDEKGEYILGEGPNGYKKLEEDELDEYQGENVLRYTKKALSSKSSYKINKLVSDDYGTYYCEISTNYGEEREPLEFKLCMKTKATRAKRYALEGRTVNLSAKVINQASDLKYSYQWMERPSNSTSENSADGYYWKKASTQAVYKAKMPKTGGINDLSYESFLYKCDITATKDGEEYEIQPTGVKTSVNVFHNIKFETKKLPQTKHRPSEQESVKGYKATGAVSMTITFNANTDAFNWNDLGVSLKGGSQEPELLIVDKYGNEYTLEESCGPLTYSRGAYEGSEYGNADLANAKVKKLGSKRSITVKGDQAIFLFKNGNSESYGYKVDKITKKYKPPVKGKKATVSNVKYKVTKTTNSTKKSGEVVAIGVKSKNLKKATVKPTIKINGYTFKVTAINKNTFKNCKKVTSITIGKNVKTIAANAFNNTKKLKKITFKGNNLKTVKKKAFAKTSSKLVIKVPAKKKAAYRKLFTKAGFKGKVQ